MTFTLTDSLTPASRDSAVSLSRCALCLPACRRLFLSRNPVLQTPIFQSFAPANEATERGCSQSTLLVGVSLFALSSLSPVICYEEEAATAAKQQQRRSHLSLSLTRSAHCVCFLRYFGQERKQVFSLSLKLPLPTTSSRTQDPLCRATRGASLVAATSILCRPPVADSARLYRDSGSRSDPLTREVHTRPRQRVSLICCRTLALRHTDGLSPKP